MPPFAIRETGQWIRSEALRLPPHVIDPNHFQTVLPGSDCLPRWEAVFFRVLFALFRRWSFAPILGVCLSHWRSSEEHWIDLLKWTPAHPQGPPALCLPFGCLEPGSVCKVHWEMGNHPSPGWAALRPLHLELCPFWEPHAIEGEGASLTCDAVQWQVNISARGQPLDFGVNRSYFQKAMSSL